MLAQLAYLNQVAVQIRKKNKRVKINLHNASVAAKKAAERALEEQLAQEQALQEQIAQEQIAQEQALQEQIAQEQALQEQLAQEQALAEQLAQEQALAEQLAQEQALQEQIADEKVDPENKNIFLNAFKHANTKADECVIKPSVVSNNNQGSLFLNSIKHSLQ
jgi:hypothetical protein